MTVTMRLPTVSSTTEQNQQPAVGAHLDATVDGLRARELLEPALLLSAGYLALPFLLRQALLLLTPLLAVCGIAPDRVTVARTEATNALPQ